MSAPSPPRALRPPPAAYAGAWVALAAVYAALYTASGLPAFMAVRGAVAVTIPCALAGFVSFGLARRWPWTPDHPWRFAARLLPSLLSLAVASTAAWVALIALDGRITMGAVRWPAPTILVWQTVINGLLQLALTGIGYAWQSTQALDEARDRAARAEVLRTRAELALLRSQLQPHFVLNTLHALLGLVRRDPARAENALERLGELLRFGQWVHQTGSDWVPLSREWDFVKSYLALERLRLGDRLQLELVADAPALEVSVPPFALQPLVENAIVHAVAPRASGGRVEVSARLAQGRLCLCVEDDGAGASPEEIAASPRMGLRLLQERLAALYAGRAHLTYETLPGGGFRALLDVPEDGVPEVA